VPTWYRLASRATLPSSCSEGHPGIAGLFTGGDLPRRPHFVPELRESDLIVAALIVIW
jgi:hypothetical protein